MPPPPCIVAFCKKNGSHNFPKDVPRRTQWIEAIEHKKPGLSIRKHSRICSDHFKPTDFSRTALALLQPKSVEMLWLFLVPAVIGLLIWKLVSEDENPLDSLPGPKKWPIVGNAFSFIGIDSSVMFLMIREFKKLYGDRFVIKIFKRRILHVNSPEDVEAVLSHSKNIAKSLPYKFLEPWLGTGLLLSTGSKWHKRRKILTPTFHFNILKNFTTVMEEKSRDLVMRLKDNGERVEVLPFISDFTLFTICETAMGTQLDSDKSAKAVEYKAAIMQIGNMLLRRITKVWLHLDFIFERSRLGRKFAKSLKVVHEFADEVILERKKNMSAVKSEEVQEIGTKKRMAMLDLLLEEERKGEIDVDGIKEEVNTFMFEGHDTTAMAITFALMLLADHEEVQDRIYEECERIFGGSDRTGNMADLGEMKYLEAVIKEVLRLYPSVPFIARTITENFYLGDLKVKKGSEVAVHIYDLHRRPELFPEPERFNPDRFLTSEHRHPYAYVPFSAGPRNCIGQRFAMLEMKCVLSEICRSFRITPVSRGARPSLTSEMVLRPIQPILINFVPRTR